MLNSVAIVVPLSLRTYLTLEEQLSLQHLVHYLGEYDKYFIAPERGGVNYEGFMVKRFSNKFFGSALAHDSLMLSRSFYASFSDYDYILDYHLDALVFSNQLAEWCATGLDYIGAPWIKCQHSPWVETPRVGNGGFSLRKVESFLRVFDSIVPSEVPVEYWENTYSKLALYQRALNFPKKYLKHIRCFNNVSWELRQRRRLMTGARPGEELFWADRACHYFPGFKVASFDQGLRFAFEVEPRKCFEMNGLKLPFGCHAWARYDREFWQPYLLAPLSAVRPGGSCGLESSKP